MAADGLILKDEQEHITYMCSYKYNKTNSFKQFSQPAIIASQFNWNFPQYIFEYYILLHCVSRITKHFLRRNILTWFAQDDAISIHTASILYNIRKRKRATGSYRMATPAPSRLIFNCNRVLRKNERFVLFIAQRRSYCNYIAGAQHL